MTLISGLAERAQHYDAFIVDLWGVLHDGATPYPGAIDSLVALRQADKQVVLLSNAPRPSLHVARRLEELGFAPSLYHALMTSGQLTWQYLKNRPDSWYANLGNRCYLLGPDKDNAILDGLEIERVDRLKQADFILNTGAAFGEGLELYDALLRNAAQRNLPMICANPDLTVVHRGRHEICAGALAAHYERLGGAVRYHGKPHREIYDACFNLMRRRPDRRRVLAIGDSLRTDIAGAAAAGIDSLFVAGGIHAKELGAAFGAPPSAESLTALYQAAGHVPSYAIGRLVWA